MPSKESNLGTDIKHLLGEKACDLCWLAPFAAGGRDQSCSVHALVVRGS